MSRGSKVKVRLRNLLTSFILVLMVMGRQLGDLGCAWHESQDTAGKAVEGAGLAAATGSRLMNALGRWSPNDLHPKRI